MTPEREAQLKARVIELEEKLNQDAEGTISPEAVTQAKKFIQTSINEVQIACKVLGIVPTEEQRMQIEDAIVAAKALAIEAKQSRETLANWGD